MRRIALSLIVLCLALSSLAFADEWSKTYQINGQPDLRVQTSDANIQVDTWDQNNIEARVTTESMKIGDGGLKILESQTGNSVVLDVRFPHTYFSINFHIPHVTVQIHMPREGKVALRTGDGDIRLSQFKGSMDLRSGDGSLEVDGVDGTFHARTSDGHIRVSGRFDQFDLGTGDGRIEARATTGSTVASDWDVQTGDGRVTLQLPDNLAANIELHTGDGHITLGLPVTVEGQMDKKDIRGKLNGGGERNISVHTGDGSIRVEKS